MPIQVDFRQLIFRLFAPVIVIDKPGITDCLLLALAMFSVLNDPARLARIGLPKAKAREGQVPVNLLRMIARQLGRFAGPDQADDLVAFTAPPLEAP
jgi:hypothetical protein